MYKCRIGDTKSNMFRVYPGGDEFVFVIYGDQCDAIGFSNRLVDIFKQISEKTLDILGSKLPISFHCGIVNVYKQDTFETIFQRVEPCYFSAKKGNGDFTIYWYPNDYEKKLIQNIKSCEESISKTNDKTKSAEYNRQLKTYKGKLSVYDKARTVFEVMTPCN